MKRITIVNAENGSLRDMAIHPGTTAEEVLTFIGRSQTDTLSSGKGHEPFGGDENVYEHINDGAKLFASTPVTVGNL